MVLLDIHQQMNGAQVKKHLVNSENSRQSCFRKLMDKFVTRMGREQDFLNWMVEKSTIEMGSMKRIAAAAKTTGASVDSIILELGILSEDALADQLALFLNLSRISLDAIQDATPQLPDQLHAYLISNSLLPLAGNSNQLHLATARPLLDESARAAAYFSNRELVLKVATFTRLEQRIAELRNDPLQSKSEMVETILPYGDGDA